MCFSANASFASAGVLAGMGSATLWQARAARSKLLALTPLLFAAHQLCEGLIWQGSHVAPMDIGMVAVGPWIPTHLFLFIALVFWPLFIPVAVAQQEAGSNTKSKVFFFLGLSSSAYYSFILFNYPTYGWVNHNHITYELVTEIPLAATLLYCVATVGPCLFSKHLWIKAFGCTLFASLLISQLSYRESFSSVWCFFAAILSVTLFFHFSYLNRASYGSSSGGSSSKGVGVMVRRFSNSWSS